MKIPKPPSIGEETLAFHLTAHKIAFQREHQFDRTRRYRADFLIQPNILVEVEGGTWSGGRHTRGAGYEQDCAKYNCAVANGYKVLRFTTAMVRNTEALHVIRKVMAL